MTRILLPYLQIIYLGLSFISCEPKQKERETTVDYSQRIKSIMESVHDPMENVGSSESQPPLKEGSSMIKFVFNRNGTLLSKNTFDSKGNLEAKKTYKYTSAGDTLEAAVFGLNDALISKWINKFDKQRELVESKEIDAGGKVIGKRQVERRGDDTTIVSTFGQVRGELVKIAESSIQDKNRIVRNSFFSNGKIIREVRYSYDDNGNKIEIDQFYPLKRERSITQLKYDKRNNNIGQIILNNNLMISSKVSTRYDKKNNVTEILTYGITGRLEKHLRYTYQYNEFSHWTKRIAFENNKPVSVVIHRIAYH